MLQEGGYRRLNVAVTRARRRMTLVSSFTHHDLDPVKVQRAIVNLVKNAREALEPLGRPGHIGVAIADDTRDGRDDLVFTVEDDGPGLAPEIAQRVFETFASFGKAGGTGLGLALVKRIAEDHRGGVTVEQPAGGGCRFIVRLPRT